MLASTVIREEGKMLLDNYEYGLKIEELVEDDVSALLPALLPGHHFKVGGVITNSINYHEH